MRFGALKDDPYVELCVLGMPHDTATQCSPHQNNTGRLVVDQDFAFDVRYPELAVLLLLIKDQDNVMSDTILGYATIPLAELKPGESVVWYSGQPGPCRPAAKFSLVWAAAYCRFVTPLVLRRNITHDAAAAVQAVHIN